jgi:hypothetical protein
MRQQEAQYKQYSKLRCGQLASKFAAGDVGWFGAGMETQSRAICMLHYDAIFWAHEA